MASLALPASETDGTLWVSSSSSLLASLSKAADEAAAAVIRILLDGPGRFSQAYTDAAAALTAAQNAYAVALAYKVGMSYAGVGDLYPHQVVLVEDELVLVRLLLADSVQVGRAMYGTVATSHPAGTELLSTELVKGDVIVTVELAMTGSPISPGVKGDIELPFAGTIQSAKLLADTTGDIVVDVWKSSYSSFPPVVGGSITASAKPTLSGAQKYEDAILTGWTTAFSAGDVLRVNVDSSAGLSRVTLSLTCLKS